MDGRLIRLLLVEDNPGDVRLLRETLRDVRGANLELGHALTLEDGLKRVAAGGIDVILLDLSLPDASGVDTVTRTVNASPEVPIIVFTGLNDDQTAMQALRAGAQDYLVKGQSDGNLVVRAVNYAIERKHAQIEHQRLETQLQNAQRLESLGVLAGGIAHDFNNLLTIITCNAQFLHSAAALDQTQQNALQDLETAAAHATEMTRSLLAFSRPTRPQAKPIDLNDLVADVHRFLRRVLPATIDFRIDCATQPCIVSVDSGQMRQVLINLCVNARDAMPTGGTLEIRTRRRARHELPAHVQPRGGNGEFICLSVADTGTGMDADTLRQIFDPFFSTKSKDRGTGLGLAIVYKILEIHSGAIDVTSQPGQGTCFDVYFPATTPPPAETAVDPAAAKGHERLLILDDEEMIASLMKTVLESRGYHVIVTHQPDAAIERARAAGAGLDLAIVDYSMPAMTGDVCLAEIRRIHPQLRAILVTGDPGAVPEMTDGRTRVLAKPFTATALAVLVREMLDEP